MKKYTKYFPYLFAVLFFYMTAFLFTPQVLQNKILNQSDINAWKGMANEIITYNESHPDESPALWTNSMFSGMPATSISVVYEGDYTGILYNFIHKLAGVRPPSYLIISMIGAFLMFLAFGMNVWLSVIGAIAVTFCSYNMQIMQAGHNTKMVAIAFMPWVMAAIVYAYRKKNLTGALLFAFALSFQIKANHVQITYYLGIIILAYTIAEFCIAVRKKSLFKFLKTSVCILIAGLIGIATNVNHLWPTYEYSKYTMRGGSELAGEQGKSSSGLDVAYATAWSYSPEETPNLLIPNFNGGASSGSLDRNSETYKALIDGKVQGADQIVRQLPLYWGEQPSTAGPMYLGAVSVFLFVLGLILLKGAYKWWIASVSLIAVLLSWGSNLISLTELFFNYAPMYNKFRTVSMILVILQITIPILAVLTLDRILKGDYEKRRVKRGVVISLALTAGLCMVVWLVPSIAGSFVSSKDSYYLPELIQTTIVQDRISLLRSDAVRSALFIVIAGGLLWTGYIGKIKKQWFFPLLGLLVLADLWMVDKRYLNDLHFISERAFNSQYALRPADSIILEDRDPDYRVLDLSVDVFNDARSSFYHKTIGGYSAAKLQRYQDMIDTHITDEIRQMAEDLSGGITLEDLQEDLGNYPVLNMLNAKYIIVNGEYPPLVNNNAFGNAWFVTGVDFVTGAMEEIESIDRIDAAEEAVVSVEYRDLASGFSNDPLSDDEMIVLTDYSPNMIRYGYNSKKERLAVFSEIYYPAGWRAYIDGKEIPIFRANYILRALKLPSGTHEVEFVYKPDSFVKGALYSKISSGVLIFLLIAYFSGSVVYPLLRKRLKKS